MATKRRPLLHRLLVGDEVEDGSQLWETRYLLDGKLHFHSFERGLYPCPPGRKYLGKVLVDVDPRDVFPPPVKASSS
jgi:hypothetical protein